MINSLIMSHFFPMLKPTIVTQNPPTANLAKTAPPLPTFDPQRKIVLLHLDFCQSQINARVMQPFLQKVATDRRCAIKSFIHQPKPDSDINPKHYSFAPLRIRGRTQLTGLGTSSKPKPTSNMSIICQEF